MTDFLYDGPDDAFATIILAHGAGAGMESGSMELYAKALASVSFKVARFEFGYMAARRDGTSRPPPSPANKLIGEYVGAIANVEKSGKLIIGGKSMGGRMASMIGTGTLPGFCASVIRSIRREIRASCARII